jgi:hypothetical protein
MRSFKLCLTLAALALVSTGSASPTMAEDSATVRIDPNKITLGSGGLREERPVDFTVVFE